MINVKPFKMVLLSIAFRGEDAAPTLRMTIFCGNGFQPNFSRHSREKDCVVMSLRGSKTTEAISQFIENKEIAALPSVARKDTEEL